MEKKNTTNREMPQAGDSTSEMQKKSQYNPKEGHEISRTGRETDKRDVKGMPQAANEATEEGGQNAIGGKPNR